MKRQVFSLLMVGLMSGAVFAQEKAPAKSVSELLKDRAAVQETLTKMTKDFEANRDEFEGKAETKAYNAKQNKLRDAYQATDRRLKELDSAIAGAVAKEAAGK